MRVWDIEIMRRLMRFASGEHDDCPVARVFMRPSCLAIHHVRPCVVFTAVKHDTRSNINQSEREHGDTDDVVARFGDAFDVDAPRAREKHRRHRPQTQGVAERPSKALFGARTPQRCVGVRVRGGVRVVVRGDGGAVSARARRERDDGGDVIRSCDRVQRPRGEGRGECECERGVLEGVD